MNKDHSHSWVRISHGLNQLVTNLNNKEQDDNEQETSDMQFENYALKSNARAFASRSKAMNHIRPPIIQSIFFVMVVYLEKMMERLNSRDLKDYLQNHFVHYRHWSDEKWKSIMAKGGGNKKRFQYCTDSSGEILYFRVLQGHSGRNLTDPSLQDNVSILDDFFKYIYHVGCAINLHSIIISGLIPGGQN